MHVFRSVRFNIGLFCVIAAACALGTFIPQVSENPEKVQAFLTAHAFWGPVFERLALFNLFHSLWFSGLLGLMAFDVIVCKLYNKPPDPGLIRLPEEEARTPRSNPELVLASKPYRATFSSPYPPEAAVERAAAFLGARGYAAELSTSGGRSLATVTRHRPQRWGSYVSHVSLVVILLGALLKALFGFEERLPILEGQSKTLKRLPIEVQLDRFEVAYYAGTREPKRYASDVHVYRLERHPGIGPEPFEESHLIGARTIKVNDPFEIPMDRFGLLTAKLYQASWGAGGMFRRASLAMGRRTLDLKQRAPAPIPGTDIMVTADLMLPNFQITPAGRYDNASLELKNPAVRFLFARGGTRTPPLWLLRDFPELCFVENEDGTLDRAPRPPFRLTGLDPVLFSGLQAGFDPGFPVVMLGAAGMLIGLSLLFYLHRRRLWVLASPDGDGTVVHVAGYSSRGPREFQREFDRVVGELRRELGAVPALKACAI